MALLRGNPHLCDVLFAVRVKNRFKVGDTVILPPNETLKITAELYSHLEPKIICKQCNEELTGVMDEASFIFYGCSTCQKENF